MSKRWGRCQNNVRIVLGRFPLVLICISGLNNQLLIPFRGRRLLSKWVGRRFKAAVTAAFRAVTDRMSVQSYRDIFMRAQKAAVAAAREAQLLLTVN